MSDSNEKSKGQNLLDKIGFTMKNAWETIPDREQIFKFCDEYKGFLDKGKTEREFAKEAVSMAEKLGFENLNRIIEEDLPLTPGDKVYRIIKNKAVVFSVIGKKPMEKGARMIGAHIDSPRLDIKQNPLYENTDMAFLKTHYYGGIKKYQWVTIPLALHGVIIKKDGTRVEISIGEDENDPVFTITDLLPHLAKDQMEKKMREGITGEGLNSLSGSIPYDDKEVKEKVKLNTLHLLNEQYDITEEDLISAELELVPAFNAKDIGFDRSMIGSYGQDDRVCAYTSMMAIFHISDPEYTAVCVLSDKEEIGSMGNTGAESRFLEDFLADLCHLTTKNYTDIILRRCLNHSVMLSADVNAGMDPNYEGTHDKLNAAYLGKGLAFLKYSGARGKAGASDAHAEFFAKVKNLFNDNDIPWHTTELGAVDKGGGGTISRYIANLGVDVIDCGIPLLSMHSPFEVASKVDIYTAYKGYRVFFKKYE